MTRLWPEGEPVETWAEEGVPARFYWNGVPQHIIHICNRWRVHTRWWEPGHTIWREYWKVVTDKDLLCLLYQDLLSSTWLLARLYD